MCGWAATGRRIGSSRGPPRRAAARLRAAVAAVLGDAAHRRAAEELAAAIRALPPVDDAVGLLEDLAGVPARAAP